MPAELAAALLRRDDHRHDPEDAPPAVPPVAPPAVPREFELVS
jgi:hypothetical protein